MNLKRNQSTSRGIVEATQDEDELIRRYRRIEALFRTLQVGLYPRPVDRVWVT